MDLKIIADNKHKLEYDSGALGLIWPQTGHLI